MSKWSKTDQCSFSGGEKTEQLQIIVSRKTRTFVLLNVLVILPFIRQQQLRFRQGTEMGELTVNKAPWLNLIRYFVYDKKNPL